MKRHYQYLKFLLRHKWFVIVAGLQTGAPLWRLLIHDWTKFLPSEWGPYARTFFDKDGAYRYKESRAFLAAWNYHQKRNKHHWQYWVFFRDQGSADMVPMPEKYIREMVADWMGAGRAITGNWEHNGSPEVHYWFNQNRHRLLMHRDTRWLLAVVLDDISEFERVVLDHLKHKHPDSVVTVFRGCIIIADNRSDYHAQCDIISRGHTTGYTKIEDLFKQGCAHENKNIVI